MHIKKRNTNRLFALRQNFFIIITILNFLLLFYLKLTFISQGVNICIMINKSDTQRASYKNFITCKIYYNLFFHYSK